MPRPSTDEFQKVMQILKANEKKSFVQRILDRNKYPTLDLGNGQVATHMMSTVEQDGKHYVFPTVLYDGKQLKQYDWRSAFDQVIKTGNYIEFDDPQEAEWFSRRYKAAWGE
jgi:hypothetical protein